MKMNATSNPIKKFETLKCGISDLTLILGS